MASTFLARKARLSSSEREAHPVVVKEHGRPSMALPDRAHALPGRRGRRHGRRHLRRRVRHQVLAQHRGRGRAAPVLRISTGRSGSGAEKDALGRGRPRSPAEARDRCMEVPW